MRNLIQLIKSIRIKQILTVFLAGCLLVISTACSQGNLAQRGGKAYTDTAKRSMSVNANQDFKGGMNNYNDDPRYSAETAAKTKALVDRAKRNQKRDLSNYPENVVEGASQKIDEITTEVPRTVRANTEKAANYIQDKSENLKENLSKVPGGAKQVFDEATNTAQNAIQDADRASKRTVKEVKGNFEDLT